MQLAKIQLAKRTLTRSESERFPNAAREMRREDFPTATALLDAWERPWSGKARERAARMLLTALRRGLDVMEMGDRS